VISIRDYRPADLSTLRALATEIQDFERQFDPALRKGTDCASDYVRELFEIREKQSGRILVAEVDGDVAGMTAFRPDKPIEHERPHVYISDLVVFPRYRRQGVARALIDAVEAEARSQGIDRMLLLVYTGNQAARRAYDECGFEPLEVLMVKRVKA
jgi:ribosomal protein S18 acetylase RimI-like enzyme